MPNDGIGVPLLREAPVPHELARPVVRETLFEASRDELLLRVPNVARFLVPREGPVLAQRAPGATDADLRCFRDETVAAASAVLRGELVLRGAAVSIRGRAVVLCGRSAAGKSALAAALAQRGHAVLADAVTVVGGGTEKALAVAPVAPEPVLWPDAAKELGLSPEEGRLVRPPLTKRAYSLGPDPVASPPAAAVVLSADGAATVPRVESFDGAAKLEALVTAGWHLRLVHALGLAAARFAAVTRLATTVPCLHVIRPVSGAPSAELAELVEQLAP